MKKFILLLFCLFTLNAIGQKYTADSVDSLMKNCITETKFYNEGKTMAKLTGTYVGYYPNGEIAIVGHYKNNKKCRTWWFFDTNGFSIGHAIYKRNKYKGFIMIK